MENTLSSAEAARLLGVSQSTLYAYVSRGLLTPLTQEHSRRKRYPRDAVLRLAARQQDGRRAGHVAERAVSWGLPVMESCITSVANGVLCYRGKDAVMLARQESFAHVAHLLWATSKTTAPEAADFMHPALSAAPWRKLRDSLSTLPPLPRAMALLPAAMPYLQPSPARETLSTARWGMAAVQVVASASLGVDLTTAPLEQQIVRAWTLPCNAEPVIRAALILCADHELNPSTFAARCVASTNADLHLVLAAALASLSGDRHGGESLRVRAWLDDTLPSGASAIDSAGDAVPGFGHPLYPAGDPRCRLLLDLLPSACERHDELEAILRLAGAVTAQTGRAPNVDFGLATLERVLGLPPYSGQILFAIGRSAGWVAHAMEQRADGQLIRPRARYVGNFDSAG